MASKKKVAPPPPARRIVSVGMSEDDFELISMAAHGARLPVSAFMRQAGIEKVTRDAQRAA